MANNRQKQKNQKDEVVPVVEPTVPSVKETKVPEVKPVVKETTVPKAKKVTLATIKTEDDVKELFLGNPDVQNVMNSFENYILGTTKQSASENKNTLVSLRFELFNNLKNVIETEDNKLFKQRFDYVNAMFRVYSESMFSHTSLIMFDYLWVYGSDSKLAFQNITKVISTLADPKTRSKKLKGISVEHIFKFLSPTGVRNLTTYYNL